jgi:bacteriophage N4 adsorption protein B
MLLDQLDNVARMLAYPVGLGILGNGLEEMFFDANYFLRGLHRRSRRMVSLNELRNAPKRRIAIMVAAWQEADVIEQMLDHNLRSLDYDAGQFDIFVGTYCNDPDTQQKVDLVARRARNVHKIVVPHDGPTCKADCLNWIYQGIVLDEKRTGRRYDILLMHDSEDLIHPLALRLYSLLIPEHDFVQTPVFSLPVPRSKLVGATYIDEFAEAHLKDMLVREAIGGLVPSAGVGSAFCRNAFEEIAAQHGQKPFNPESLTEDYEIGLKFRLAGKKVHFALRTVERPVDRPPGLFGRSREKWEEEYIATREYFPDQWTASVRQRSRWVLGIALQTWQQIGWKGPLAVLYHLYRDRKALAVNALLLGAYLLMAYLGVRSVASAAGLAPWSISNVAPDGSALDWILSFNLVFLAWRTIMKFGFVGRLYGAAQAALSLPRLFLGNIISLFATGRAVNMYAGHRLTGKPLRWLKTKHAFPSHEVLRAERRRLGEFLLDRRALSADDLDRALELQKATRLPLGEVLSITGVVPAREVRRALGEQLEMSAVEPDPRQVPRALLERLPEAQAEALEILPLSMDAAGSAHVAFAADPTPEVRRLCEQQLGCRVVPELASAAAIARARRQAYRRLVEDDRPGTQPLGETLVAEGHLSADQLPALLDEQRDTGERLGELLVRKGLVRPELIAGALRARSRTQLGYRPVRPEEVDVERLRLLGYGLCAFYGIVPLTGSAPGKPVVLASASPVHPMVLGRCQERLGAPVEAVLAPGLNLRVALAAGGTAAWPVALGQAGSGMDGAELRVLAEEPAFGPALMAIAGRARRAGQSPLDHLENTGQLTGTEAARLRARTLGLGLVRPEDAPVHEGRAGLLPPGIAALHGIRVQQAGPGALVMTAPRPTARLAAEVAALFPAMAIAWQVLAPAVIAAARSEQPVAQVEPPAGAPVEIH